MSAQTFTQRHVSKGVRMDDSLRLRQRAGQFFRTISIASAESAARYLSLKQGPFIQYSNIRDHLEKCSLNDFLDAVTHIYNGLPATERPQAGQGVRQPKQMWLGFIEEAFTEEHVSYRVLQDGSVTYAVDEAFEVERIALLDALAAPEWQNARRSLEESLRHLNRSGSEGKVIRSIFDAMENVFKIKSGAPRLGRDELRNYIEPKLVNGTADPIRSATNLALRSFQEWVAACHQYRHADSNTEPTPPPKSLAIWVISCGYGHLRWLLLIP